MVQSLTYVLTTCFCCVILSSYVAAIPAQYLTRPSIDSDVFTLRYFQLPETMMSRESSAMEKRAMMRLGKRMLSQFDKRAIMRLGK
ncbi:hypothetical protein Q1695_001566 [Nippostrongylus brasiliensis]|nr:hypothetical protein Q1695_001566 [Nippostrongylus brasiliensis]